IRPDLNVGSDRGVLVDLPPEAEAERVADEPTANAPALDRPLGQLGSVGVDGRSLGESVVSASRSIVQLNAICIESGPRKGIPFRIAEKRAHATVRIKLPVVVLEERLLGVSAICPKQRTQS